MDQLIIIQHNVCTWSTKRHELYNIYRTLDPDIILLNDTGVLHNERLKLHHYTVYTSNKENRLHRGTAIAIKSTIPHTIIDDFETDLLGINVETRQGTITVGTDYVSPRSTYLDYADYLQLLRRRNPVYILGDLNARHHFLGHNGNNPVGDALNTLILRNQIDHVGPFFPTYIRENCASTPDIVISNKETFHNILLTPGPVSSSDHIPMVAKITTSPIQIPIRPRPQFSRADWDSYKTELQNHRVPNLVNATTQQIDKALEDWSEHIMKASDEHIPKLTHRIIPGVSPNDQIRQTHDELQYLYELIRLYGALPAYAQQLKRLRRTLREQYKSARMETWNEIVHNIDMTDDPTKFWKSIKRFQGNQKQHMPYLRDEHNNKLRLPSEKAALFTRHYTKLYTENSMEEDEDLGFDMENIATTNHYISENMSNIQPFQNADTDRLDITFPPISFDELKKLIMSRKQKAPGPSKITARHLKNLPDSMIRILADIFNKTMSLGHFPTPFKKSITIFIPKPQASQYQVTSYRPISLLDTEGKLLDKYLNQCTIRQLQFGGHLNPNQHGFTPLRGTHTALATIWETLANANTQKRKVNMVLRDISKAFDKVWYSGLQYKILTLELPTCLTKLLCSYITNRQTSVRIGSHMGPPIHLQRGVPQGGCLSPTLYNMYTLDMPEPTASCKHITYADDLTQIIAYPSRNILALHTSRAIQSVTDYERKWKIQTNTRKFTMVPFFHRKFAPITVDDGQTNIPYAGNGTALGMKISSYSLVKHVTHRIQQAKCHVTQLSRFRNLSTNNKIKIMKATLVPSLIYPTVPMNVLSRKQFQRLQVLYNKAVRIVANTTLRDRNNMESLHRRLRIDPINIIIQKQAKDTWRKLQEMHADLYNSLRCVHPRRQTHYFPSSRKIAEGRGLAPIYSSR